MTAKPPSPRICLNHAGASPSSKSVVDRAVAHLKLEQTVGGYAAARDVADELESVYESVANLIQARSKSEVALVESATVAWTRAFYSMMEQQLKKNRNYQGVILISEAEYAANVVAASEWARNHGWSVLAIPSTKTKDGASTGVVDLEALHSMLSGTYEYHIGGENVLLDPERIAIACITHVPTNSGIVNPAQEIGQLLHEYNLKHGTDSEPQIFYLVDACQVR
ncbi:unnamed protein product [Cylindrotheca closterium]|uniref:Aminotransferase class V domain-containing protein n=1 Tax=Cylindrotheca closterium TaxID=2856 RepID=A0AAD2JH85_9STRA|nr:unnamed protein product [Cylindrotheca closterium]